MRDLRSMRNIGKVVAGELEAAGVPDGESLAAVGALGAAVRLKAAGFDVCRSKLAGLQGALRDTKWNLIPPAERAALWSEFESFAR
jgi:DNA transformation protein and related proteins